MCGAKIQWLKETQASRGTGTNTPHGAGGGGAAGKDDTHDPANLYTVVAVFPNTMAAQSASFKLNNSGGSLFKLRAAKKNYDLRILERASSQWGKRERGRGVGWGGRKERIKSFLCNFCIITQKGHNTRKHVYLCCTSVNIIPYVHTDAHTYTHSHALDRWCWTDSFPSFSFPLFILSLLQST